MNVDPRAADTMSLYELASMTSLVARRAKGPAAGQSSLSDEEIDRLLDIEAQFPNMR